MQHVLPRLFRNPRSSGLFILLGVALLVGYVFLLEHEERTMDAYYSDLRDSNPARYLTEIRQAHGFQVYLDEYLALNDYKTPTTDVPPFLIGRWSLFEEEKRVGDDFIPSSCLLSLEIEDERLKLLSEDKTVFPVAYTMDGDIATAHRPDGAPVLIQVVAYGSHVHHIEVQNLPGVPASADGPLYGYLCR